MVKTGKEITKKTVSFDIAAKAKFLLMGNCCATCRYHLPPVTSQGQHACTMANMYLMREHSDCEYWIPKDERDLWDVELFDRTAHTEQNA